jgi:hypothetical protein
LIKQVVETDPVLCPRCARPMKIVSLIDAHAVIAKILRHLKLRDRPERPPPPPPEGTVCYDIGVLTSDDAAQWFDARQ